MKATKKPTRFYFKKLDNSKRGYNILIEVFYINKDGYPVFIGYSNENSAAWKGGKAVAGGIISEKYGYKFDGYRMLNKKIKIFEI
jgi:hypothetical protein